MKTICATLLLVGTGALAAACASEQEMTASPTTEPRISAAAAVPKIAAAECDFEARCKNVGTGLKYSSRQHCLDAHSGDINQDFGEDADCGNGVSVEDLNECLSTVQSQDCGGVTAAVEGVQAPLMCRSNALCLD
jgi:hypothetical protein